MLNIILKSNIFRQAVVLFVILLPVLAHAGTSSINIDGKDVTVEQISRKMMEMADGSLIFHTEDNQTGVVFPNGKVRFLNEDDQIRTTDGVTIVVPNKRPYAVATLPPDYKFTRMEIAALSPRSFCGDLTLAQLPGLCAPGKQRIITEKCIKTTGTGRSFICLKNEIDS